MKYLLHYLFGILVCLAATLPAQDRQSEEFAELNKSRGLRKEMLDFLKTEGMAKEGPDGLLKAAASASPNATKSIDAENADRTRQFAILAALQNKPASEIAREFARKLGVDTEAPQVVMRIHGSNTIGSALAPALIERFLASTGATIERKDINGVETRIVFRLKDGKNEALKMVEIGAYGSETAFDVTEQHKNVGLKGKFCDIGMSSRPIKDEEAEALKLAGLGDLRTMASSFPIALDGVAVIVNPANSFVQQLTVDQISRIFAGEITDWAQVGAPAAPITIYARDDQSGTYDTFKGKVLKPYKRSIAKNANRFEDSTMLVRGLAGDPHGIGFVGLPYVDSTVSLVAVQAGADTRALSATRLTVKSLDYPLARLLYFYAPVERSKFATDFLAFTLTEAGQEAADATGFVGQGAAKAADLKEADTYKQRLLDDPAVPQEYKTWIAEHNRKETAANVRFETGRMVPDINSNINIRRFASRVSTLGKPPSEILLIGFADNVGDPADNLKLSRARAESVGQAFSRLGLTNVRVEALGQAMPVADNKTEEGRAANRRVEIWIKP